MTMALLSMLGYDCYYACQSQNQAYGNLDELKGLFERLPNNGFKYITYSTLKSVCQDRLEKHYSLKNKVLDAISSNY